MSRFRAARLLPLLLAVAAAAQSRSAPPPPPPHAITEPLAASVCADCQRGVSLAGGDAAELMVTWNHPTQFRVFRRLFDADGNAGADVAVPDANRTAALVGAAPDGAGGWLMGWFEPGSRVFVQPLDGGEMPLGAPVRVNEDVPAGGDEDSGTLVGAGGRAWVVVARSTTAPDPDPIVGYLVDSTGTRLTPPVVLGTSFNRAGPQACMRPDGGVVAAWNLLAAPPVSDAPNPVGVALRAVEGGGRPLAAPTVLAAATLLPPTVVAGYAVGCAADNGFAAAWHTNRRPAKKGWDILGRRFDANGRPRGGAKLLNAGTAGDQLRPALLFLSNGTLLAVWESREAGGNFLKARRFAASGKAIGGELILREAAAGELAQAPKLAAMPGTGRFALGWSEAGRGWVQIFGE